jgi:hypothetical protein
MALITGSTSSRLVELEKYSRIGNLSQRYFTSSTILTDGVNLITSTADTIINYYIGGIEYFDNYINSQYNNSTFVINILNATADIQQDNFPIIKDFSKGNVIGRPEVKSDVFIVRQSLSVFEQQYRLRVINNLSELNFYAGGGNFKIIDNI